jgi:hypothetical protein
MTTAHRPSHTVVLRTTLAWSAAITGALAVVGAVIGYLVAGMDGLWSALVGVLLAALFLGMTAVIILIAGRMEGPEKMPLFFGIVLGGWALKLVIFIVALLLLRGQPWIQGQVFFFAVLASVIASLVIDMVVMARARVPYVGDVPLPTSSDDPADRPSGT